MNLEGIWYNQLGSKMILEIDGTDANQINGIYETAVGSATGQYKLTGRTDSDKDASKNVGFVVSWENQHGSSDSVTSWSGELQEIDGEEIITAFWLLTRETNPSANWKSTNVGKDVFTRNQPTEADISKALKFKTLSNPD